MSQHNRREAKREITEYYCDEPTCEFYGKYTQQGVCHSTEPDLIRWDKLHDIGLEFAEQLKRFKCEHLTDKDEYISWLEAMYECAQVNWTGCLDECIFLRRELALLKRKLERYEHGA